MEVALLEKKLQIGWSGGTASIAKSLSSTTTIEEVSLFWEKLEKRIKLRILLSLLAVEQRHEDVRLHTSMVSLLNKAMKDEKWVALVAGLVHSRISGHLSISAGKRTFPHSTRQVLIDDVAETIMKQITCDENEGSDATTTSSSGKEYFEPAELRYLLDDLPSTQRVSGTPTTFPLFVYVGDRPDFIMRKGEKKGE